MWHVLFHEKKSLKLNVTWCPLPWKKNHWNWMWHDVLFHEKKSLKLNVTWCPLPWEKSIETECDMFSDSEKNPLKLNVTCSLTVRKIHWNWMWHVLWQWEKSIETECDMSLFHEKKSLKLNVTCSLTVRKIHWNWMWHVLWHVDITSSDLLWWCDHCTWCWSTRCMLYVVRCEPYSVRSGNIV